MSHLLFRRINADTETHHLQAMATATATSNHSHDQQPIQIGSDQFKVPAHIGSDQLKPAQTPARTSSTIQPLPDPAV